MNSRKTSKFGRLRVAFAVFLLFISTITTVLSGSVFNVNDSFAISTGNEQVVEDDEQDMEDENQDSTTDTTDEVEEVENQSSNNSASTAEENQNSSGKSADGCKSSLGALGWLVCPTTGKISEAIDWLYGRIEEILVIRPISTEDGSPIYEIWKYFLGFSNIVFVIFLLIVIYSQLTGFGISNYGVKKALPKLIVMAILVNLSFLICLFAIDVSNILGNSIRGLFKAVEESAVSTSVMEGGATSYANLYSSLAGGTALAVGGAMIAFDLGAIWMLIPTVLGAIVSVVTGLITISLRQAVVVLLVMISPLAIVAYVLPNTEKWFQKWKELLIKMLIFYPMFSLLYGASSLAGFAIIMSAKDGFGLILGMAVQILPLFFSWKLMQMSGTILSGVNMRLRGMAARPLMANRAWAGSHMMNTRMKRLASERPISPSLRLMQFMANRRVEREANIHDNMELTKMRGMAYRSRRHYTRTESGVKPSRRGEQMYEKQARSLEYQQMVMRDANTMNKGLSYMAASGTRDAQRLGRLDNRMISAAIALKTEQARGEKIEYDNAKGMYERMNTAINAHMDDVKGFEMKDGKKTRRKNYQFHLDPNSMEHNAALVQYNAMQQIMEGNVGDVQFAAAATAYGFDTQKKIVEGKMQKYFDMTVPTQDVVNRLNEFTQQKNAGENIDMIISGLRVLNKRGDTDLVRKQLENLFNRESGIELGSHALQAISSFCMFDVKGNDPALRRFGKYINLQTAKMFNEGDPSERRTRKDISFYEYVNGEYIDRDEKGNIITDENGQVKIVKTKKSAPTLLKGTSFKDMERTAIMDMQEMIRNNSVELSVDANGNEIQKFSYKKFKENESAFWNAIMPNVIGDHFSFLSGSEQINAMSKGITGIDVGKHKFDWEGIFGKENAKQLTAEQKKDYIEFLNKRTKTFLGGQVPSQIARTKSDMLEAVRNQYALREIMKDDPELFEKISNLDYKMSDEKYKELEQRYLDGIKKEFIGSFKKDALKGFVKMHHKGYQGEAKDGLIQLLDPDALYEEYFANSKKSHNDKNKKEYDIEDEDDGAPIDFDDGLTGGGDGPIYNGARKAIDSVFASYRGINRLDVEGFWNAVKDVISKSNEVQSKDVAIDEIEEKMKQYSDTSELYVDIMEKIFGGFSD